MLRAVRVFAFATCLATTGCYPAIDPLITDEPRLDSSRSCSAPSEALGIAAPASVPNTSFPELRGASTVVDPGSDLQAALDSALPGDELVLQPGGEYPGPLRLRYKPEPGVIVIRSSALDDLPEGRPVSLDDVAKLPSILASEDEPAVIAEERAQGYRLAGLELRPATGTAAKVLVHVGSGESTIASALPDDIVVDRTLIRGDPELGAQTGIQLHSRRAAIIDSRIVDIKSTISGGGGLVIDNSTGPILVHDSVIEAGWLNIGIGQNAPGSPELFPSDISICKSVLTKPAAWKDQGISTKALIEIDRGRRVLVAGTVIETSWSDVFPGIGVALAGKGVVDGQPSEDLAFVDVRLRSVNIAFDIGGSGALGGISRLLLENSEITNVDNRIMRVLDGGIARITWVHTTAVPLSALLDGNTQSNPDLLLRDNLLDSGLYGIRGDAKGAGIEALDFYFAPWVVEKNIIVGASQPSYPPDNFYPPTLFEAGVVDAAGGNYRLVEGSPFAGSASDGTNPGADIDRLEAALPQ